MPKAENLHKSYVLRISLMKLNSVKIASFKTLQLLLFKFSYLVHFNAAKYLYIDLDMFKSFRFEAIIYYIKKKAHTDIKKDSTIKEKTFSFKLIIQLIMFLSRLLKFTEMCYWSMKLKLINII